MKNDDLLNDINLLISSVDKNKYDVEYKIINENNSKYEVEFLLTAKKDILIESNGNVKKYLKKGSTAGIVHNLPMTILERNIYIMSGLWR